MKRFWTGVATVLVLLVIILGLERCTICQQSDTLVSQIVIHALMKRQW